MPNQNKEYIHTYIHTIQHLYALPHGICFYFDMFAEEDPSFKSILSENIKFVSKTDIQFIAFP